MRTVVSTWLRPGKVALEGALVSGQQGGSLMDALVEGLAAAEDDPDLIAIGRGSLPNTDGELELDASIMRGDTLAAGAVCGVRGLLPCIQIARWVMEKTPHVMLCGDQARRFGIENGLKPQSLWTDELVRRWANFQENPERERAYVHSREDEPPHDTVTMLAHDSGEFVAASSTSGMPYKRPGRVGDSPIIGAGIYADNEAGCAGATGLGEELWKACASFSAVEHMRSGASAQEACEAVARQMRRRQPASRETICVILALDKNGGFGAGVTTGKFDLWVSQGDAVTCHHFEQVQD